MQNLKYVLETLCLINEKTIFKVNTRGTLYLR